jgi:hypothetical protein
MTKVAKYQWNDLLFLFSFVIAQYSKLSSSLQSCVFNLQHCTLALFKQSPHSAHTLKSKVNYSSSPFTLPVFEFLLEGILRSIAHPLLQNKIFLIIAIHLMRVPFHIM